MRAWLIATMVASGLGLIVGPSSVGARGETRTLEIYNIHTKETLKVTYKRSGSYDREAMSKINHIMRDWRRNEPTNMDPELIDLIWLLHTELGSQKPVYLISGYRSAKTNAKLRRRGGGQAKKSQHIQGKAADIHFPDIDVKHLRNSALIHEVGGVGYYPGSGIPFVHVDTAGVRAWPRVPRQELAMLFPSGKTKHIPSDGRPLTTEDGRIAMAKLKARGLTPVQYAHGGRKPAPVLVADAPAPKPTQIASAPAAKPVQLASAEPPKPLEAAMPAMVDSPAPSARPKPILASLGPADVPVVDEGTKRAGFGLSWLTRLDEIAEAMQPSARPGGQLASVGQDTLGAAPAFYRTEAAPAPEIDTEHPEELSYQPYSVLSLLTDRRGPQSSDLMGLAHPEQEAVGVRLLEPAVSASVQFGARHRSDRFLMERRFTGPAVASVLAALPQAALKTAVR